MSEREEPVIRDKRRVRFDPLLGAVPGGTAPGEAAHAASAPAAHSADAASTHPTGGSAPAADAGLPSPDDAERARLAAEVEQLRNLVAERTADLQRVQAEYANYRKRVERDRALVRDLAVADTLALLLPVLDDIGRARAHGELEGGFKQVAESFEAIVTKLGLVAFGDVGEPFDPTRHEALMHAYSDEVTQPTVVEVFAPGYTYAGRIIRPARVSVAEPTVALPDDTPPDGTAAEAGAAGAGTAGGADGRTTSSEPNASGPDTPHANA